MFKIHFWREKLNSEVKTCTRPFLELCVHYDVAGKEDGRIAGVMLAKQILTSI